MFVIWLLTYTIWRFYDTATKLYFLLYADGFTMLFYVYFLSNKFHEFNGAHSPISKYGIADLIIVIKHNKHWFLNNIKDKINVFNNNSNK